MVGKPDMFNFAGRVNRVLAEGAEVVDCGRYFGVWPFDELEVRNDYKGYYLPNGSFLRMPTLRKLKQMASYYDKKVWKRFRDK